jgi:hypothetical protein
MSQQVTLPLQVISFPKSGRTWLRAMLDDIGVPSRYTHDESGHVKRKSWQALNGNKTQYRAASILLLIRDPRDTAVSGYFQLTRRLKISAGSFSEILRDDRHGIRKICHFNLQWFAAAGEVKRFAVLSYEQIHKAPEEALSAVATFAGVRDLNKELVQQVAANREFKRMRAAEASGELAKEYDNGKAMYLSPGDPKDHESFKMRRGLVGGYVDYLSESDLAYCDMVLSETRYCFQCEQAVTRWGLLPSS